MKITYFVPIYKWGEDPDNVHGNKSATHFYSSVEDLSAYENDAVGYFEISGIMPTQNEYKNEDS